MIAIFRYECPCGAQFAVDAGGGAPRAGAGALRAAASAAGLTYVDAAAAACFVCPGCSRVHVRSSRVELRASADGSLLGGGGAATGDAASDGEAPAAAEPAPSALPVF